MRLVQIDGGLGNQMFQYAFYCSLKALYSDVNLNTCFARNSKQHNGLELERVFNFTNKNGVRVEFLSLLYYYFERLNRRIHNKKSFTRSLGRLIPFQLINEEEFSVYSSHYLMAQGRMLYFKGYWQSEKYFKDLIYPNEIFRFPITNCNFKTEELVAFIKSTENCVSIHIRGGDYNAPANYSSFGNICNQEYYRKAIETIGSKVYKPTFIILSDDNELTNRSMPTDNSIFVDWNRGTESWQDMFIMSKCKHNIVANSSFSWWGAYLNDNPNKIVIAPRKWHNLHEAPDICPPTWIRI